MNLRLLSILLLLSVPVASIAEETSGTVVSKGKTWIAVMKAGDADSTMYLPQWKGTAFDSDILAKIGELPVGCEVKLTYKNEDHPRILSLEVTAAKGHVPVPATPRIPDKAVAIAPDKPATEKLPPDKAAPDKTMLDKPAQASGEAALKSDGWTNVVGNWRKKAERVYEVVDGKLEAKKTNGSLQAVVHRGNGSVKIFVRNGFEDADYSGFGVVLGNGICKLITPYLGDDGERSRFSPYAEKTIKLTPNLPKDDVLIQIQDSKLQISLDGKREKLANFKISQKGTFIIEVNGGATIEFPMAKDDSGLN